MKLATTFIKYSNLPITEILENNEFDFTYFTDSICDAYGLRFEDIFALFHSNGDTILVISFFFFAQTPEPRDNFLKNICIDLITIV